MWYFHALWARVGAIIDRHVDGRGGKILLDAGCGAGGFLRRVAQHRPTWRLTGLDYAPEACAFASERTGLPIIQGSIESLPAEDEAFDLITSLDVICQVEDDARAMREFARCLRPGGAVIVTAPALPELWSYHDETNQTKRRYRRDELSKLARQAGLEVEFATYANFLPLPLIMARRKLLPAARGGSDIAVLPAWAEALMRVVTSPETWWLGGGRSVPIGSSVFVVATRKRG